MKVLAVFLFGRVAVSVAAQSEVIPGDFVGILLQLPLVGVVVWLQMQNQKWFERMLALHDESIKEVYAGQQKFLTSLLNTMEARQSEMVSSIKLLEQQVMLFGANLSEVTELADFADRIMEKIER